MRWTLRQVAYLLHPGPELAQQNSRYRHAVMVLGYRGGMSDGPTPNPPQDQPSWPTPQAPQGPPVSPGWTPSGQPPVPPAPPGWNPQPAQPAQAPPGWVQQPPQQGGWQPGAAPIPPPPGVFVPGEQGPKKRRKWPWILLGIFLLMVLGIGACTVLLIKAVSGPTDFGNKFAEKLYSSPSGAASDLCTGSAIDAQGVQQAHDNLVAGGWTGDKRLYGAQVDSNNGSTTGAVTGTLGSATVTIEMAKQGGDWCVTNFVDTSTLSNIPDLSVPDLSVPDLSVPDLTVPELEITPAS
jgi:hypothetical protein